MIHSVEYMFVRHTFGVDRFDEEIETEIGRIGGLIELVAGVYEENNFEK